MRQHSKVCRLCAKSSQNISTIPIFERSQKANLRRIFQLTGVKLKSLNNIPTGMCSDCKTELNRANEFRERCIAAQTYFSTAEYKAHGGQTLKEDKCSNNKTTDADTMVVKVELLSDLNEYETGDMEKEPEGYLKRDPEAVAHVESEFVALNEGEIGEEEVLDQAKSIKYKNEIEVEMENPIEERERVEDAMSISVGKVVKSKPVANECHNSKNNKSTEKKKLKKERENKESIYICDQCGNNFKYRNHFYAHIKRHTGIKPVQCEICPDRFFTQVELKRHMRRHTGERPFACQYCQRRFTDYSTRVKHERIHTNERPFECPQCDKAFTTSYVLKNHILVHTGERSFKCELCNKSFPTQKNLIVHTRSLSHKQNVEREKEIASTGDERLKTSSRNTK